MKEKVTETLRELTGHKYIKLVSSGDTAILCSLLIAKSIGKTNALIPYEGGWISYETYPPLLGLNLKKIRTRSAKLDLTDLSKKANKNSAVIINHPAGYFCVQELEKISDICKSKDALFILDISGSISGDEIKGMADLVVCSFGKDKPVNLGYGGMIGTSSKILFSKKEIFTIDNFYPVYKELSEKLKNLDKRMKCLYNICKTIKKDLNNKDIIYAKDKGINVVLRYHNNDEKKEIIDYCDKNDLEYTLCPRYIRVLEDAISIEVKRR